MLALLLRVVNPHISLPFANLSIGLRSTNALNINFSLSPTKFLQTTISLQPHQNTIPSSSSKVSTVWGPHYSIIIESSVDSSGASLSRHHRVKCRQFGDLIISSSVDSLGASLSYHHLVKCRQFGGLIIPSLSSKVSTVWGPYYPIIIESSVDSLGASLSHHHQVKCRQFGGLIIPSSSSQVSTLCC